MATQRKIPLLRAATYKSLLSAFLTQINSSNFAFPYASV